jgi:hypothetical protein
MPGNPREIVTMAERRFPVRIRIGVPPSGFGQRYTEITEWLDGNCGADGWAITPSGMRGVLNDAVSIYFLDATLASAFVARWCAASRVETEGGLFRSSRPLACRNSSTPLSETSSSMRLSLAPSGASPGVFKPAEMIGVSLLTVRPSRISLSAANTRM